MREESVCGSVLASDYPMRRIFPVKKNADRGVLAEQPVTSSRRIAARRLRFVAIAFALAIAGATGGRFFAARSQVGDIGELGSPTRENVIVPSGSPETPLKAGVLSSENYQVGQIVLGGDVGLLSQGDELTELSISDIRGETLGSKNQNEGRALITWKTSKAANSTLRFGKSAGASEKTIEEDGFGMTHSAVLSNLDLASTYLYTVSASDRYGNEVTSDSHAVYTGTKVVSLFELIVNALQNVFGWAVKK